MPPIQYRLSASRGLSAIACSNDATRVLYFLQLVMHLAELMAQHGFLRPFAEQLQQQRLGDDVLLGRHQSLNQVGSGRPMARIELQGLDVTGDGILGFAGLDENVAEIAPARRQSRHQPQRRFVVGGS